MSRQWADMNWQDYLDILLQRRGYIIVPFVLSLSASGALLFVLPKVYKSKTTILVEQQKVPEDYVKSSVTASIDQRLSTIQQQIMSGSLLKPIIEEFNLYGMNLDKKNSDALVGIMRKHIEVDINRRGQNIEAFSVSFEGPDPKTVMLVTNKLSSMFIEENLKVREAFVEGTSAFLDNELNMVKAELEIQEDKIREFKQKYIGELSEQTAANLRTLDRFQIERQTIQEALAMTKGRQASLLQQDPNLVPLVMEGHSAETGRAMDPVQIRLMQLRTELADLQTRFTDKYPDVIRLKDEIERLERDPSLVLTEVPQLTGTNTLQSQFNQNHFELLGLEKRLKKVSGQTRAYEKRVENAPLREQQMLSIRRDYENTQAHYQSLLDKKLNARIAENLEKRQKGEQFRILDSANLPLKPYKPDVSRILLLGLIAGLGAGGAAVYLREMMDSSFRKAEEVEAMFNLSVLASIPYLNDTLKQGKRTA